MTHKICEQRNKEGFTLAELLIIVAIIAVLVAISIPVFTSQLEKSREATDAANIRSQYAEIMSQAISSQEDINTDGSVFINLKQTKPGWQTTNIEENLEQLFAKIEPDHGIPDSKGTAYVKYEDEKAVLVYVQGTGSASAPAGFSSFVNYDIASRWVSDGNGGVKYAPRNPGNGEFTINPEKYTVPKGTVITLNPTGAMGYSYYILDKDGKVLVDSNWVSETKRTNLKQYTVKQDGCSFLLIGKYWTDSTGTVNRNANTITQDEMKAAYDGVSIVLPKN